MKLVGRQTSADVSERRPYLCPEIASASVRLEVARERVPLEHFLHQPGLRAAQGGEGFEAAITAGSANFRWWVKKTSALRRAPNDLKRTASLIRPDAGRGRGGRVGAPALLRGARFTDTCAWLSRCCDR